MKPIECNWQPNDVFYVEIKELFDSEKEGSLIFCVCETIEYDTRIKGLGDVLPVTYLKYAEKIPENLSEIDDLEFMLNYRIQEEREYRFLWIPDGFGILKSKLQYAGNYAFRRHDGDGPLSIMDKLRMMRYWKYIFNRD